jgi:hypothetical protein
MSRRYVASSGHCILVTEPARRVAGAAAFFASGRAASRAAAPLGSAPAGRRASGYGAGRQDLARRCDRLTRR